MSSPIYEGKDGKWYFWDETWSNEYGPFDTEEKARERLKDYVEYLETGKVKAMTPSQAYQAALEAAAKVADRQYEAYLKAANKAESETMACRFDQKSDACNMLAAAIRALPAPKDAGDMVLVPKASLSLIIDWMDEDGDHGGDAEDSGCAICTAVNDIRAMIKGEKP